MKLRPKYRLVEHFAEIDDPRIERTKRHKLIDILTIAILAVICGAEGWVGNWYRLIKVGKSYGVRL
jgi:hypothetical protein